MGFEPAVEGDAQQRHCGADDGIEHPEEVGRAVLMDDHVAAYLPPVEAVVPDLERRHEFEGDDVEDVDIERVVAAIDQEALHHALVAVEPRGDGMDHQEADGTGDWQGGHRPQVYLERHALEAQCRPAHEQRGIEQRQCPVLGDAALVATV